MGYKADLAPGSSPVTSAFGLTVEIHSRPTEMAGEWRAFQAHAAGGPHQTYEWIDVWLSAHPASAAVEPAIVICRDAGRCVAVLPFAIRRHFGCATLEWLGADQGNYSSGLFDADYWSAPEAPRASMLLDRILLAFPGVDAVHLADHPADIHGIANPLADLPGVAAPSDGYAFSIGPDWQRQYESRFSARYRRNLKRKLRRLENYGPVRLVHVGETADRLETLATIFDQKSEWFAQRGIADIFADQDIRRFYRALVSAPRAEGNAVRVYELRVGSEIAAACVDLLYGGCYYGLIASTTSGDLSRYGPGNILFHRLVETLAHEGVERFDCGAGENEQKLRWCTERRERRHAIVPVTEKGRLYAAALKGSLIAKTQIKQSAWLLRIANLMRRHRPKLLSSLPLLAGGGTLIVLLET